MWKRYSLTALVALTLVLLLLARMDTRNVVEVLKDARWPLLLVSLALGFFTIFLKAQRWSIAIAAGKQRPTSRLFTATVIGVAGNSLLPMRLGDVLRAFVLRKHNDTEPSRALLADWGVLAVDLATLCLLLLVGGALERGLASSTALWMALTITLAVIVGLRFLSRRAAATAVVRKLPGRLGQTGAEQVQHALDGLRFLQRPTVFVTVLAFTIVIWATEMLVISVALAAFGISATFAMTGLLVAALGLAFVLPLTPGNVGTYQIVAILVLSQFEVPEPTALAFGLGYQAFTLLAVLFIGTLLLAREGFSLRQVASQLQTDPSQSCRPSETN